jgi:hypothetical protein
MPYIQIIQQLLDQPHHDIPPDCSDAAPAPAIDIARLEIFAEVDPAWHDRLSEMLQQRDLVFHAVAAVVDDDLEAFGLRMRFGHDTFEEGHVGLVAREDCRTGRVGGPLLGAGRVVFDLVEVNMWKVLEPGVI